MGVREVDWLGTSMGGILGMLMASIPGNPIKRLIINDVGPFLPKAALERIAFVARRGDRVLRREADVAEHQLQRVAQCP